MDLPGKMFAQRLEGAERVSPVGILGKGFLAEGIGGCKML